jgi:glyoxylase-like metal-dependent hydrolase (beta-lactamase superfamily II)
MERITDSIHHLDELLGGPTLILGDGEVTLVDTGVPGSEDEILAALDSLGRDRAEIRHVLITHADADHVGGIESIVAATGARVYASQHEANVIEGRTPSRRGETKQWGRIDEVVEPGETLPLHGGIEVVGTAGHTVGHVSYYLRDEGVLLAGDCVNNMDGLAGSPPHITADAEQARGAVRTLARLAPSTVCFGHGPSLVGDAAQKLAELDASLG